MFSDLVDTHAHLVDPKFRNQFAQILERSALAGVNQMVVVGTTLADSLEAVQLCSSYPGLFPTAGIHPNHIMEAEPGDWERLESLARSGVVVALGETGLDRYWDRTPFPLQIEMFQQHLELAGELNLPVIIHCRECETDIIDQLTLLGRKVRGVLHSFTGNAENARSFLELGLHISYAGMVTFRNATLDTLRATVAGIPEDRLLIETDSPYLAPHPFRGKTNEPALVVETLKTLAALRGVSVEELGRITTANARGLFGLPAGSATARSTVGS